MRHREHRLLEDDAEEGSHAKSHPRSKRLSLDAAINLVAERCECSSEKAGEIVHDALGEDVLRATATVLVPNPNSLNEHNDTGSYPAPSQLWASYFWWCAHDAWGLPLRLACG
jgi:hypothetical protein